MLMKGERYMGISLVKQCRRWLPLVFRVCRTGQSSEKFDPLTTDGSGSVACRRLEATFGWRKVLLCMTLLAGVGSGCSIKKIAMNKVGDALASGGATFAADDDPELIKSAAPF